MSSDNTPFAVLGSAKDCFFFFEFIARVLTQIPQPRKHGVHYFGAYASRSRVVRKKRALTLHSPR